MEAEESTVLGAVAKQSLVKATADWEKLMHAVCSELWIVWISDSAIITCSYEFQESNKSNYQSKPRL
jgi:hypothetical protein